MQDVDRAWMIAYGMPIGPFGLMDMIGLDAVRDIELVYYRESGDASDAPPRLLLEKIARGELGVKTGQGFYNYMQACKPPSACRVTKAHRQIGHSIQRTPVEAVAGHPDLTVLSIYRYAKYDAIV